MVIDIIILILVLLYLLFITSALTCCVCYILFQINGNTQTNKLTQDAEGVVQGTDKSVGYDIKARSKQTVKTGLRKQGQRGG